jgi:ABC-type bacteriocin/lantibiotic exporter with double-glycine peptidase domain
MSVNSNRFWKMLKPDKKEIYQVYTFALFKGLIALTIPLGIQTIINFIQGGNISTSWIMLSILIGLGIALNGWFQLIQMRILENIQQHIFTRSAFDFVNRIPKIKSEELQNYYAPELMNRFFEVMTIQKSLPKTILHFSTAILQIFFGLLLLSLYHPFFIIFSIVLVLMVVGIISLTSKRAFQTSVEESKFKYKLVSWLEEMARSKSTFKTASQSELPLRKTDEKVTKYLLSREKHYSILKNQFGLLLAFKIIITLSLLLIGGLLVINQQMNIGQFVAAEIIILLIIDSSEKIITSLESVYDMFTSLDKLEEIYQFKLDTDNGTQELNTIGKDGLSIELVNIKFGYSENDLIIDDLSFKFLAGKKYCLSGNNGSGKSTLMNLISGNITPVSGNLCINELPVQNYSKKDIALAVSCALKDDTLFEGTITENITLGRPELTPDQLNKVLDDVYLSTFIKSLPNGIDTILDPMGKRLPHSINQKIILARCLAGFGSLNIIETNTDSIEKKEKTTIIDTLFNNNKTVIISSNDEYIKSKCDFVILMKEGKFDQIISK